MAPDFLAEDDQLLAKAATLSGAEGRHSWKAWRQSHRIEEAHGAAHHLLPIIFWTLRPWPAGDRDVGLLKGTVRFTWSRNRLEVDCLIGVLEALGRRSIRPVIVDSAALALGHYTHLGLRRIDRLRLLVDSDDVAGAVECLGAAGLERGGWRRADRLGTRRLELVRDRDRRVELEPTDERRNGASTSPSHGPAWRTLDNRGVSGLPLDPTGQLLRLLSDIESAVCAARILPLVDAHVLLESSSDLVDWQRVLYSIESSASLSHAPTALAYLQRVLYARVPAAWLARLTTIRPSSRVTWRARATATARRRLGLTALRRR